MSKAEPKLLLIEKEAGAAKLLLHSKFEVVAADTLALAVEKLNGHTYDLILLDLALPDGGGLGAFQQIHAAAPQTPTVMLADTATEEVAARTMSLGADDYLIKTTLTAESLGAAIRKTLDRHYCQLTQNYQGFLLQTLMNNIPDAVYFKDTRSRFLMISRALAKKHHLLEPQQAVGKTDADYFLAPHAQQALADEQTIMRTGQPMEGIEESETWPDGTTTWASTTKMPLRNQSGRIVGTFGISRDITIRKEAQLALAEKTELLHKKNVQIEEELKMARELQLAMLPQDFPLIRFGPDSGEALKYYSYYMPSGAVSGDFFDVIQLSETSVGIFICDVMGHGVRAALVTAMIHSLIRDLTEKAIGPGELLSEINQELFKVFRQTGTTMYATAVYMVADIATGKLSYANAAHPCPLRLRRNSASVDVLACNGDGKKGAALGLFRDSKYATHENTIAIDDLLVFYTDGIIEEEGQNGELFGTERLRDTLIGLRTMPPKEMLAKVLDEVRGFAGHQEFSDDVCVLGVDVKYLRQPVTA